MFLDVDASHSAVAIGTEFQARLGLVLHSLPLDDGVAVAVKGYRSFVFGLGLGTRDGEAILQLRVIRESGGAGEGCEGRGDEAEFGYGLHRIWFVFVSASDDNRSLMG